MEQEFPIPVAVFPGGPRPEPPAPLSDYQVQMIHAGLMRPGLEAIRSMAREIRKWRGVPDPDLI